MRIIAGRWRSHRIVAKGRSVRPTTDRARQVLFDILGPNVIGKEVLDLYAGSGALGLEALSRGAKRAVFVDADPRACAGIKWNVAALDAWEQSEVWTRRVGPALAQLVERGLQFDWIFADPPYGKGEELKLLQRLGDSASAILAPGCGVVIESSRQTEIPERCGCLILARTRALGGSTLRIFRREGDGRDEEN